MGRLRALALILMLIFAFLCVSQLSQAAKAVPAGRQAKKPAKSEKKVKTLAKKATVNKEPKEKIIVEGGIRTWLSNGHIKFLVLKTEIAAITPSNEAAKSGTRWFLVFVEIKNTEKFRTIYSGDFNKIMLLDSNLRYYNEHLARKISNWAEADDKVELPPGASFKTVYVFTVPSDSIPIKIIFDSSSADNYPLLKVRL